MIKVKYNPEFSQKIIRLRKEKGWSQTQLALHAGVHSPTLSILERHARMPTQDVLLKLAQALGISLEDLTSQ